MTQATTQHVKEQEKLEKDKEILEGSNKLLRECNDRLLKVNEKQLGTLDKFKDKINLQTTELDEVKKENVQLKDFINNKLQNVQQPCTVLDTCSTDTLKIYNATLQDKITGLEKQILAYQNTARQAVSNTKVYDLLNQVSKYKVKINTLQIENKSLSEQLLNFRNMHNQIITGMQLNNLSHANGGSQLERTTECTRIYPMVVDENYENELKPLQVNIIDSDADESATP